MYAACGRHGQAKRVLDRMPRRNAFSWNTLMAKLFKSGRWRAACKLFEEMPHPVRDTVSWTTVISGLARDGRAADSLQIFGSMRGSGCQPNDKTLTSVIGACAEISPKVLAQTHAAVTVHGGFTFVSVGNALVYAYSRLGQTLAARRVLQRMKVRDALSWSAMVAGYVRNGEFAQAMELFGEVCKAEPAMNHFTFAAALGACSGLEDSLCGAAVHATTLKAGQAANTFVGNALVDMYAKCGNFEAAFCALREMPSSDSVSWTALIVGLCRRGRAAEALGFYGAMVRASIKADCVTFSSVLSACADIASLESGRMFHAAAVKGGSDGSAFVGTSLVNMYAKCGEIADARKTFDGLADYQNVVPWNALITGYGQNGNGTAALEIFNQMLQNGISPDAATFIALLSACCHAGLVDDGYRYFKSMTEQFGIAARRDHYACMIDIFGRYGHLQEAEHLITQMPHDADASIWCSLLNSCEKHRNATIAVRAAERFMELDPDSAAPYIVLSNILSDVGRFDEASRVREKMREKGIKKDSGCSWIEGESKADSSIFTDWSRPESNKVYAMLEKSDDWLPRAGYVPIDQRIEFESDENVSDATA